MAERVEETIKIWQNYAHRQVTGKLSSPTILILGRAYYDGRLDKPLEMLSDTDLLSIFGIGEKRLVEIRRVIPAPKESSE